MTNDELERVMNFIIERQGTFADQMVQSNVRMTRLEEAMQQQQAAMQQQQQQGQNMQAAILSLIESQQSTSADVRNLSAVVDRLVETVATILDRTGNSNGSGRA